MQTETVLHGRRRGQARSTPTMQLDEHGVPMANAADLQQVTVLSKADWDRIQLQLNRRAIEEDKIRKRKEEKELLHSRSKDMVKNWSNTIGGQRQKKLEARKLREQKEEQERCQIDIEEAKFQASKRKDAIEKAKTQQYYQTDRVKGFHGALLLTEVLKERDAQVELKILKEKAGEGQDEAYLQRAQHEYENAIKEEHTKARQRIKLSKETAAFQKSQIREHLTEHEEERSDERIEGDELKVLATQHALEKKRLEQIREEESHTLMAENRQQIQDIKHMKLLHQQQQEEEDDECRIFAAAKRKMMKLRAEKERELHNDKQVRLEKIRERLHAQLQQKMDDEDDRITRAEQESEAKRLSEDNKKDVATHKILGEIAVHRHKQMKERETKESEERRKMAEMLAIRKAADEVYRGNEEDKSSKRYQESKQLQSFHVNQVNERDHNSLQARQEQLSRDKHNEKLVQLEEEQFQEYANKVINHCEKGGRNIYPLRKAAQEGAGGGLGPVFPGKGGVRPSYMVSDKSGVQLPNYQRETTDETKQNIYGQDASSKRLGFVW